MYLAEFIQVSSLFCYLTVYKATVKMTKVLL